jgi:branched-chain amino acid aminotransferase
VRTVTLVDGAPAEKGKVLVDQDDSLFLGHGAFETLRTYAGHLFGLEAHLERLLGSCAALGIRCPDDDTVVEELYTAADAVGPDAMVRIIVTGAGSRIVRAAPIPATPSPFRAATRHFVPPAWLDGTVKHVSRAFSRMAVASAGVDEVLWVDGEGSLLEGTRSNIVGVRNGSLITPPADGRILAGVTREAMIDTAIDLGIEVLVDEMPVSAPYDELYVCSTLKELTGIAELDGRPAVGAGPVGAEVLRAFRAGASSG